MSEKTKHPCSARVYNSYVSAMSPCCNNAKYQTGGKWYCGTHEPGRVNARNDKSQAKWDADQKKSDKGRCLRAAAPDLLEALEYLLAVFDAQLRGDEYALDVLDMAKAPKDARAAIAKAKGESA